MMIVTFDELNNLLDVDQHFYLSGTAAVIYSSNIDREYRIIQKFHQKEKEYLANILKHTSGHDSFMETPRN